MRAALIAATVAFVLRASTAHAQGVAPGSDASSRTIFVEFAASFVPYANDVPLMVGAGVRLAELHELWARIGFMPTGDDGDHAFAVAGYRIAFRPHRVVRPVVGALVAALPATCGHDAMDHPTCAQNALFIFAATGGIRIEPAPWIGFTATLALGTDTYPYPFGMVEIAATFALPPS